jgi:hypothetical protein
MTAALGAAFACALLFAPSPDGRVGSGDRVLRAQSTGAPVLGKTVVVRRVKGRVRVRGPGKGRGFVTLRKAREIPVGSQLDTRGGTVKVVSARDTLGGTQSGRFAAGIFQVLQSRQSSAKGLTTMRLRGSLSGCKSSQASGASAESSRRRKRRRVRRGRANTNGRWKVPAKRASGTSKGTAWVTTDRCTRTDVIVKRGEVKVRDLPNQKSELIGAGEGYGACSSSEASSAARRRRARSRGRFRACGRYSAATVRGG